MKTLPNPRLVDAFFPRFGVRQDVVELLTERGDDRWRDFLLPQRPPAHLVRLHDSHLFARLWRRVLDTVRNPTCVAQIGADRCVQVLDSTVFVFHGDQIQSHVWACEQLGCHELKPLDEWTVVVQGMPWRNLWLGLLAEMAAAEVSDSAQGRGIETSPPSALEYARWAFGIFAQRLPRCADLRLMRRKIATALHIDPELIRLAGRVPRTLVAPGIITLGALNLVARHHAAFELLQVEAPALVPVFAAMCAHPRFPDQGQPAERLKRHLRSEGLSERAWRLVAHADSRLLLPLRRLYEGRLPDAALAHLQLLDSLEFRRQPPNWFIDQMLGAWGDANHRWDAYVDQIEFAPELWANIARVFPMTPRSNLQRSDELDLVLRWAAGEGREVTLDKRQRHAGWPWLLRRARCWEARCREERALQPQGWPAPFDVETRDDWQFIALRNELALLEEARAMHNCVSSFGRRCRAGGVVLASVRKSGLRVATVEFRADAQGWCIHQMLGFANSAVDAAVWAAAGELLTWLSQFEPPEGVPPEAYVKANVDDADFDADAEDLDSTLLEVDEGDAHEDEADEIDTDGSGNETTTEAGELLCDEVVAFELDGIKGPRYASLDSRVGRYLERRHDEGALAYTYYGLILFEHQFDNWALDPERWVERLRDDGHISDHRFAKLRKARRLAKSVTPEERGLLREAFATSLLSDGNADADIYAQWGAEELRSSDGRVIYAVYFVTGYSFTSVEFTFAGTFGHARGVVICLESRGRFEGNTPRD